MSVHTFHGCGILGQRREDGSSLVFDGMRRGVEEVEYAADVASLTNLTINY